METKTTTVVRYAIINRDEADEDATRYAPYENPKDAHEMRRAADKRNPHHAPHRVIRLTIELEELDA